MQVLFFFFWQHEFFCYMHLLQHSSSLFSLLHKKRSYNANFLHKRKKEKGNAMQCELVTWEKHRRRISFFPFYNAKKRSFFVFYVHFLQCNLFFLVMHICYDANLLHGRKKRTTLTSFFCYNTKKKIFSSYCMFFWLFFGYNISFSLLHGIRRRNMHVLLFLATTYPMLFICCCISLQLLCFFGCDASRCILKFFPRLER